MGVDTVEFALAYIDPGSGSLVIQALVAALVALPVLFRNHIRRLVTSVRSTAEEPATDGD